MIEIYQRIDAKIAVSRQFVAILLANAGYTTSSGAEDQKKRQHDLAERGLVEPPVQFQPELGAGKQYR